MTPEEMRESRQHQLAEVCERLDRLLEYQDALLSWHERLYWRVKRIEQHLVPFPEDDEPQAGAGSSDGDQATQEV